MEIQIDLANTSLNLNNIAKADFALLFSVLKAASASIIAAPASQDDLIALVGKLEHALDNMTAKE